ncbi:hypothetical protein BDM02DRAFT_2428911 [Thelephora ganbajun]|uniref:Uncharacterized protein n=1 Tax=Thelephora ganbajun TaxID=370292 RepID=A0ACB6ZF31_THEGA|nr:hypothetical protein BDM02DRAFT_2428911 [Thelephora ganbajun]
MGSGAEEFTNVSAGGRGVAEGSLGCDPSETGGEILGSSGSISAPFVTVQVTTLAGSPHWHSSSWMWHHRSRKRTTLSDFASPTCWGSIPCSTSTTSTWASSSSGIWLALDMWIELVSPLGEAEGVGESARRGGGRGLGGTTVISGREVLGTLHREAWGQTRTRCPWVHHWMTKCSRTQPRLCYLSNDDVVASCFR